MDIADLRAILIRMLANLLVMGKGSGEIRDRGTLLGRIAVAEVSIGAKEHSSAVREEGASAGGLLPREALARLQTQLAG